LTYDFELIPYKPWPYSGSSYGFADISIDTVLLSAVSPAPLGSSIRIIHDLILRLIKKDQAAETAFPPLAESFNDDIVSAYTVAVRPITRMDSTMTADMIQ
jgi:hypothetical protein